jgi:hypothetical protein
VRSALLDMVFCLDFGPFLFSSLVPLLDVFSFIYLISVFSTKKTTKPKRKNEKQLQTWFVVEASADSLGKPTPLPCGGVIFPHAPESPGYDS